MDRLPKAISLVAAAAIVAGGPTTAAAQAQAQAQAEAERGGERARNSLPRHPRSDDPALRIDGDANATAAATVPEVESIIDGTETGGPIPSMVALAPYNPFIPGIAGVSCGGTLINPTTVLTAAHCMYYVESDDDEYDVYWEPKDQVYVNLYDVKDPAGVVTINIKDPSEGGPDIVVHPGFNHFGFGENDIALVFLPFAIGQEADYAKPNNDPNKPVVHDPMRVMGWGLTESGGSASDVLLETTVDYISNEECKEAYADVTAEDPEVQITDGMMCAYKDFTDACDGDSGGPLFLEKDGEIGDQPTQVGIVSWSEKPCGTYPGVYTRISYYAEWIKETVCSRSEHATKELCGSSKSGKGKSTKSSS